MYDVSVTEIKDLAKKYRYYVKDVKGSHDQLKRSEVYWEIIVLEKEN